MYKSLCKYIFSFLLDRYLSVKSFNDLENLFFPSRQHAKKTGEGFQIEIIKVRLVGWNDKRGNRRGDNGDA